MWSDVRLHSSGRKKRSGLKRWAGSYLFGTQAQRRFERQVFVNRSSHCFRGKRFQDVINTIGLECMQGIFVESGAEYHRCINFHFREHFKAQPISQLYVGEDQVHICSIPEILNAFFNGTQYVFYLRLRGPPEANIE